MAKHSFILALLLLIGVALARLPKCPTGGVPALSGRLTVSSAGGDVHLATGTDIQCYNYTLSGVFDCPPSVAISVVDMQAAPTNNLFFSIKAVNSDSNGVIPFVVRTHWGYTKWTRITFHFLAQASDLIMSGYYQIDTATLSACYSGKQIIAFIPTACKDNRWKALTFLNGFQISSVSPKGTYFTPYEVQVVVNSVSTTGITVLISTTSATQVHGLFISYVAYDPSIQRLSAQQAVYKEYKGIDSWTHGLTQQSDATAVIVGLTGFIIGNTGAQFAVQLKTEDVVRSITNFYYIAISSFTLYGGHCGQCLGYTLLHQDQCVDKCPDGYYQEGNKCIACPQGTTWDGKACITPAPTPAPTPVTPIIPPLPDLGPSCPRGTYWDQQQLRCLPCPTGCSSCPDCYSCDTCSLGFYLGQGSPFCQQVCGDGKRFVLGCDDGNTVNGDGCSSTCQVEAGFNCRGGSPNSADICVRGTPAALEFTSSGQSHIWGRIIVNVKVNYLPKALLDSATDCSFKCNNVLRARIVSGDSSAVSILASYIPNTSYSFSVEVNFAKEPIGMFALQVGLNPSLAAKYFPNIDTSSTININVNPAIFNLNKDKDIIH